MGDTGESGGRATRRQVLQAAGGALAVGALSKMRCCAGQQPASLRLEWQ